MNLSQKSFLSNIRVRLGASTARLSSLAARLNPYGVLAVVLAIFALWPLLAPGYFFDAHDGRHSVFYVSMFDEAIRDGALWPRWAMHHNAGYGYPTFIVQAPLAFYAAEFFVLLGFGITTAVKLTWAAGFLAGGWGMYQLIRDWGLGTGEAKSAQSPIPNPQSPIPALLAALLYIFIPYHLLDMYVRAALAETTLMAWFPWVFLAFDRLIVAGGKPGWQKRLLVAALAYAGVILTHVVALIAFTPLLVAFILFRLWTVRKHAKSTPARAPFPIPHFAVRILLAAFAGLAALLLSAIFLLPLLTEGPLLDQSVYTSNTYDYARHWVQFSQFFDPFWGYGFSDDPAGANDGMGFQVGLLALLLALASGYGLWKERAQRNNRWPIEAFLLVISAAILFFVTPAAAPIWQRLPMVEVIQFPWRLLALSSFTLSALGGLAAARLLENVGGKAPARGVLAGGGILALLVIFASLNFAAPEKLEPIADWREDGRAVYQFEQQHPDMLGYTRWVEEPFIQSAMTAQYAAPDFSNARLERLGILSGSGEVISHYSRGHSFGGEVAMTTPGVVQIRVYFFPGWQVRMDGTRVAHRLSPPYGLMEIDVPAGQHRIDMRMGSTPARSAGIAVSGVTLLLLVGLWVGAGRKKTSARG
ncbi:MAG: 6-pyruvoyl-tetrahydropterin synthase-related protein [Caldilineaceae bacterium]